MPLLRRLVLAAFAFVLSGSAVPAGRINQIVVFGDSLSDSGNLFAATMGTTPPPPYYQGRFSNGPVWVEDLAGRLGVEMAEKVPDTFSR